MGTCCEKKGAQPGTLRQVLMGGGERFQREGIHVYLWLIHVVVRQKPTQYCKAIILQLKRNFLKKLKKEKPVELTIRGQVEPLGCWPEEFDC